jgi:hypothetical protein
MMTKHKLTELLFSRHGSPVTIKGVTGILQGIQREDGSGRSFIVRLLTTTGVKTVYVKTVD